MSQTSDNSSVDSAQGVQQQVYVLKFDDSTLNTPVVNVATWKALGYMGLLDDEASRTNVILTLKKWAMDRGND
eukprot:13753078-Ditylum_brightwellii.AAC.1